MPELSQVGGFHRTSAAELDENECQHGDDEQYVTALPPTSSSTAREPATRFAASRRPVGVTLSEHTLPSVRSKWGAWDVGEEVSEDNTTCVDARRNTIPVLNAESSSWGGEGQRRCFSSCG